MEKTFFMIKSDGTRRGLVGEVLHRVERRDFTIEKLEMRTTTPELSEKHYADLVDRSFSPLIVDFMIGGSVITGVMSGDEVITSWHTMMEATSPKEALPGVIRGDYAQAPNEGGAAFNIVHGLDLPESVERKIALWFGE